MDDATEKHSQQPPDTSRNGQSAETQEPRWDEACKESLNRLKAFKRRGEEFGLAPEPEAELEGLPSSSYRPEGPVINNDQHAKLFPDIKLLRDFLFLNRDPSFKYASGNTSFTAHKDDLDVAAHLSPKTKPLLNPAPLLEVSIEEPDMHYQFTYRHNTSFDLVVTNPEGNPDNPIDYSSGNQYVSEMLVDEFNVVKAMLQSTIGRLNPLRDLKIEKPKEEKTIPEV